MTNLPLPSTSPAPVTRIAAASTAARGTAKRDGATQPRTTLFQDTLAQEFCLEPDSQLFHGSSAPVKASKADLDLKAGDDAAQAAAAADPAQVAAAADAAPAFVNLVVITADAGVIPPAMPSASVLGPTHAQSGAERATLAPQPGAAPLAQLSVATRSDRQQRTDAQLAVAPPAADFAAPGKFLPAAVAELRREIGFDPGVPERREAEPAVSTAIHAYAPPVPLAQAPTATLNPAVGERGWDQGLGDQLVWMADRKHQVAELHLNPPDLGPLKVTLTLDDDKASAQFFSAHSVVREAIEAAMPRLREMLADSGITLGNASVSADSFRGQAGQEPQHDTRAHLGPDIRAAADPDTITRGARPLRLSLGLVDIFA